MRLQNIYEREKFFELKMMVNGVKINKSFPFKPTAAAKRKALAKAIAFHKATLNSFKMHAVPLDRNPDKINFLSLIELYRPELDKLKGKEKQENLIERAQELLPFLMSTIISNLSKDAFKKAVTVLTDSGYAKSTINKYLSLFSNVLRHAKDNGFIVENYAVDLQYSEVELDNQLDEIVSREELKAIINEIGNPKTKLAIEFLFHTATRRSEVLKAKHEHVNYSNNTLNLYDTKNGRNHQVILNNTCIKILKKLQALDGDTGYIFKSDNENTQGGKFQKDCWTRAWRRAVIRLQKRTGEDRWLRKKLHTLRHSRITEYVAQVPNLIALQEITGHKDIRSLKRYSHTSAEEKRRLLGKLAKE